MAIKVTKTPDASYVGQKLAELQTAVNLVTGGSGGPGTFTTLAASGNFAVNTDKFTVAASTGVVNAAGLTSVASGIATAAGGAAGVSIGADGFGIYFGSGAPTITAAKGSLYLRSDGSSTSTRLYVNNGTTNWVAVTTAS